MRGDVPGHAGGGDDENDEGSDHVGFLNLQEMTRSIGQVVNSAITSRIVSGLCPVAPTTPPMNAAAAKASRKRAKPSFCSLLYFEVMEGFYGVAMAMALPS